MSDGAKYSYSWHRSEFHGGLSTEKIEDIIDNIENEIKNQLPHVKNIYIETEE